MEHELKLPELGEGIEKAIVACWHVKEGDEVNQGDEIVEVVTDKASFGVPCPCSGILKKIMVHEGGEIRVGGVLANIGAGESII